MSCCKRISELLILASLFVSRGSASPLKSDTSQKVEPTDGGYELLEGDILLDNSTKQIIDILVERMNSTGPASVASDASTDPARLWTHARVPFQFDNVGTNVKRAFRDAVGEFNRRTCVRFIPRTSEKNYVRVVSKPGCWSPIGRSGGEQEMSLGRGCEYKGIAIHEMLHTLGFYHEQSRIDRDNYVIIKWGNIKPGMAHNFQKYQRGRASSLGEPYDYGSIMHYGKLDFSKNGKPTIIKPGAASVEIGQRNGFSQIDIKQVNKIYRCVDLDECKYLNNGGCEQHCLDTPKSYKCYCKTGYHLYNKHKCRDIDECSLQLCEHSCKNTIGSYICSCRPGFRLDIGGQHCKDIDECLINDGGCEHLCWNFPLGTYSCACRQGFLLKSDKKTCEDIDECALKNGGCDHFCQNSPGSFRCTCKHGYYLAIDGKTCRVSNCGYLAVNNAESIKCEEGVEGKGSYKATCNVSCAVGYTTVGSTVRTCGADGRWTGSETKCLPIRCPPLKKSRLVNIFPNNCASKHQLFNRYCVFTCKRGYRTIGSRYWRCTSSGHWDMSKLPLCKDNNECNTDNGGCGHVCANTPGSHHCRCRTGYKLKQDRRSCQDVNECLVNKGGCQGNCFNTIGSFKCLCPAGYRVRHRYYCHDVDECKIRNGGCSYRCHNNHGSYTCSCKKGYELTADRHGCADINECNMKNGGCQHECLNYEGGYFCRCNAGFLRFGRNQKSCRDLNECKEYQGWCDHDCRNTVGSYICSCRKGYVLVSNKRTCEDIDECSLNNGNCNHYCQNFPPGGFSCYCRNGFNLQQDNKTCTDVDECAANNGGCSHYCDNTPGSFQCSCGIGFSLGLNGRTCRAQFCGVLPQLTRGTSSCKGGVAGEGTFKAKCKYTCVNGYTLKGSNERTCERDGRWTGTQAACERVKCEVLKRPKHSSVFPLSCLNKKSEFGSGCFFLCSQGYKLTGPKYLRCESTGKWSHSQSSQKCEDVEKPKLLCPPKMTIIGDGPSVNATWPLPNTTDNSGEALVIDSNLKLGTQLTYGRYSVTYTATDKSGNTGFCSFTLIVQKKRCKQFPVPTNGTRNCDTWLFGGFCTVSCKKGFGFAIPPSKRYVCGIDGEWHPQREPPTCSGIVKANKAVISAQFRGPSLPCDMFPGMLRSILMSPISAAVSKCSLYHLACTYIVADHCDSLIVQNVNLSITVTQTLSSSQLHDNINNLINALQNEKRNLESQIRSEITMKTAVKAICSQPGVVSNGQYCVRCPVGTRQMGSKCEQCPQGTVQPKEGQTECVKTTVGGKTDKQKHTKNNI